MAVAAADGKETEETGRGRFTVVKFKEIIMKIAMPVDSNKSGTGVCMSFGRAPYFLVHDTESKKDNFVKNTAVASAGGAGIKAAQLVVDNKADVLLVPRCGENAANVLKAAGIKIYKTEGTSIKNNVDAYLLNRLHELSEIHPGFHNHG